MLIIVLEVATGGSCLAILCPNCQRENSGAYSYCYSCGADLHSNRGYLISVSGGMSIVASIVSFPLWFVGLFAILSLVPPPCFAPCPPSPPSFPTQFVFLGLVAIPAFPLGFAGGLLILEGRRRYVSYSGFAFMLLAGFLSLGTPLWLFGGIMILFSIPGLLTLFVSKDSQERS